MRLYVAGRIAGFAGFEYAFAAACAEVKAMGHTPVSPLEVCPYAPHITYEQYLIADIHALLDCDGVYVMQNWKGSKGATIEVQLAMRLGKEIIYQ